ncbi:MAG: type III-B CRISPR-associated protein Cas10/Cmr2 [Thermotoga sp.]|nr:MAG: type III-B CRISPR-associated protein Cas10/Cmr2 [Thermotoga sp.]
MNVDQKEKENYFKLKLLAFLHDPPLKVMNLPTHERVAKEIKDRLGVYGEIDGFDFSSFWGDADKLASGIDRIAFKNVEVKPEYFYSPFEDKPRKIGNIAGLLRGQEEILEMIEKFESFEKKFLYAWWRFFKSDFYYIPADTRAPNHSIVAHAVRTSAIASALYWGGKVSLAIFSIGPVQDFIKSARRTRDFWAGSCILSYLTWTAMRTVIDEYGPDQVIFPSLHDQPWMLIYLRGKVGDYIPFPSKEDLSIASFPNRFFAILPHDTDILKKAENAVKDAWKEIIKNGLDKLDLNENEINEIAEVYKDFLSVDWVLVDVPCGIRSEMNQKCVKKFAEQIKMILDESRESESEKAEKLPTVDDFLKALNEKDRAYSSIYLSTVFYSKLHTILEKFLSSIKSYRKLEMDVAKLNIYDVGTHERCSVCGQFPAIGMIFEGSEPVKYEPKLRENIEELLCPICLAKREFHDFLARKISNSYPNLNREDLSSYFKSFPSTTEIAATFAKQHLLDVLKENPDLDVEKGSRNISYRAVPKLERVYKKIGLNLLDVDMSAILYDNPEQYGVKRIPSRLFKELKNVESLTNYYAILMMDGDNIGKWLSGEMNKTFEELMAKVNSESVALDTLRNKKHPMTPSMHEDFSRRLLEFSKEVREIVEDNYGVLIYSGGDDVFAMLPIRTALRAAKEIKECFSMHLSSRATMSAGIVVAHSKYPLREVISTAYDAEKMAKNAGRDTFCLVILKRSGEKVEFCSKWRISESKIEVADTISGIVEFAGSEDVSRKFFYDVLNMVREVGKTDLWRDIAKQIVNLNVKKKSEADGKNLKKIGEQINEIIDGLKYPKDLQGFLRVVAFLSRGDVHEEF